MLAVHPQPMFEIDPPINWLKTADQWLSRGTLFCAMR